MDRREYFAAGQAYSRKLIFADFFSVIKYRDNQKQSQWLNHKSSDVKRKQVSKLKFVMNTEKIDGENNDEHQYHENKSLLCPFFLQK